MSTSTAARTAFRHEALFYSGAAEFVRHVSSFISDGVAAGEPVLVVVTAPKIDMLRSALEGTPRGVVFRDMTDVGPNPARIIPVCQAFVDSHEGGMLRGVAETVRAERTRDELVECQLNESLMNLAFDDAPPWWLLCPYDTASLSVDVLDEARRSHPFVSSGTIAGTSGTCRSLDEVAEPFGARLPDAPPFTHRMRVTLSELAQLRRFVERRAQALGMTPVRIGDLVTATNEVATNSLLYGGGRCVLRMWSTGDEIVCEVRDTGCFEEPLAGRTMPKPRQVGGVGLWLCNQMCDLVQIRTFEDGSVVRLHMSRGR
jgi:anti-sigma regulatory factor (Ser/Thr protein kinase)